MPLHCTVRTHWSLNKMHLQLRFCAIHIPPNDAVCDTRPSLSFWHRSRKRSRSRFQSGVDFVRAPNFELRWRIQSIRPSVRPSGKSAFSLQLLQFQSELIDEMRCTKRSSPARKSGSDNWRQNISSPVLVFLYLRRSRQFKK